MKGIEGHFKELKHLYNQEHRRPLGKRSVVTMRCFIKVKGSEGAGAKKFRAYTEAIFATFWLTCRGEVSQELVISW